ncbi:MAG: [FeFe] hydrogenase H-cluster radical SAM maturase HydE [Candidatus Omnitrophica bacterium]|nr:[FeFe] hydrogenase H-cluster radical SAM maturase HydE [Candidatus Omnitrophota bacterium]MDD5429098.1 [FeFe] hydrogenase H-cluster radical SAM maturase HydE [Candidatus Omnitrophota bacterium]
MTKEEIIKILASDEPDFLEEVYARAYQVKLKYVGKKVYFRGIIEFSNICRKDCLYCGIRRSNKNLSRFSMPKEEIVETALIAYKAGYGSVLLQSGERADGEFIDFIEDVLKSIKRLTSKELGITLSLGEQSPETYKRWFQAGAHRYLLRIETSNKALYQHIHPDGHDYDIRLNCLKFLKDIGYQVGTGVMIGLPGQTLEDLAEDIFFFQREDIDMIGMGPYIVHKDTPLIDKYKIDSERNFSLGLKMIASVRLQLKDVNIAATTALQALDRTGREKGLKAGANIIMPNITPSEYRDKYQLYEGKPCIKEDALACDDCLKNRLLSVGEEIGYKRWGDSPHFFKRWKFAKR